MKTKIVCACRLLLPVFLVLALIAAAPRMLGVTFLINMTLSRLIALEREQIGLLKAIGYGRGAIAGHYIKMVLAIGSAGILIGYGLGTRFGYGLTQLYAEFFHFPFLIFERDLDIYVAAGGISAGAAVLGALKAVWGALDLAPAVAMQPPARQSGGPPIWCGGRQDVALRRAGEIADGWIAYAITPKMYHDSMTAIATAAAEAKRGDVAFGSGHLLFTCLGKTYEDALDVATKALSHRYAMDFRRAAERYAQVLATSGRRAPKAVSAVYRALLPRLPESRFKGWKLRRALAEAVGFLAGSRDLEKRAKRLFGVRERGDGYLFGRVMEEHHAYGVARELRADEMGEGEGHLFGRRKAVLAVQDHGVRTVQHEHGGARRAVLRAIHQQVGVVDVQGKVERTGARQGVGGRATDIAVERIAKLVRFAAGVGFDTGGEVRGVVAAKGTAA